MNHPVLTSILHGAELSLIWMAGFFVVFSLLAKIAPCNPGQPILRKDALADIAYSLIIPVFTRFVRIFFLSMGVFFLFPHQDMDTVREYLSQGYGPLSQMPVWLQAAVIFLISDVVLYWTHRWFHGRKLWRIHAIHHSSPHVDWLSAYRFHPINSWLTFTLLDAATLLAGFSPAAIAAMASVNAIYSAMVHANLNWTFGPFKYLFASPVFHRWHHTSQTEGLDKNFAPTFPLLDIMFGTFYMPEGRVPEHFGVRGSDIGDSFFEHMIWPFKKH